MDLAEYLLAEDPQGVGSPPRSEVIQSHVLLFDWGDTLMPVLSGCSGPMLDWPEVAVSPGAVEALAVLANQGYRMAIATNAADSTPQQVSAALARVGLDRFFSDILTARELGVKKIDPNFYRRAVQKLAEPSSAVVMIGDSLPEDIRAARDAGLTTVWFNPSGAVCPEGWPLQDAEFNGFSVLPDRIERLSQRRISIATCHAWMLEEGAHANLLAHTARVAQAAYLLAVWLGQAGEPVDPVLAHRGGLLHDLDKLSCRKTGEPHSQRARMLLQAEGLPELALIAHRHLIPDREDEDRLPHTWEEKLVFYADKLVEGDRLVDFDTRLAALRQRYPDFIEKMFRGAGYVRTLEADLALRLGMTPAQILERLRAVIE